MMVAIPLLWYLQNVTMARFLARDANILVEGSLVPDSILGDSCHWCRQKTVEDNVWCCECTVALCGGCLKNQHGEFVQIEMQVWKIALNFCVLEILCRVHTHTHTRMRTHTIHIHVHVNVCVWVYLCIHIGVCMYTKSRQCLENIYKVLRLWKFKIHVEHIIIYRCVTHLYVCLYECIIQDVFDKKNLTILRYLLIDYLNKFGGRFIISM